MICCSPPACLPARSMHPGPRGHQVLAELLAGLLTRAVKEVAAGVAPAARRDPRLEGLPRPMAPNYEGSRSTVCLQLASAGGPALPCAALIETLPLVWLAGGLLQLLAALRPAAC